MTHKSHQQTHDELQTVSKELRASRERVQMLEYQLSEVFGTYDEWVDMPCSSLRVRLAQAVARAKAATGLK